MLAFITGNRHKVAEAEAILGMKLDQRILEVPEIQDLDHEVVVKEKLRYAYNHLHHPLMVEDTGAYFHALNGLPGEFIKWFIKSLTSEGCYRLVQHCDNKGAVVKCTVGYTEDGQTLKTFTGTVSGILVAPRGESGFGFDPIFQPDGQDQTFAEMGERKHEISHRALAFKKLKEYLYEKGICR